MNTVADLKKGDVIRVKNVCFVIKNITNLPNGEILIQFEDMDASRENMEAYGEFMKTAKQVKEKEDT